MSAIAGRNATQPQTICVLSQYLYISLSKKMFTLKVCLCMCVSLMPFGQKPNKQTVSSVIKLCFLQATLLPVLCNMCLIILVQKVNYVVQKLFDDVGSPLRLTESHARQSLQTNLPKCYCHLMFTSLQQNIIHNLPLSDTEPTAEMK